MRLLHAMFADTAVTASMVPMVAVGMPNWCPTRSVKAQTAMPPTCMKTMDEITRGKRRAPSRLAVTAACGAQPRGMKKLRRNWAAGIIASPANSTCSDKPGAALANAMVRPAIRNDATTTAMA